MARNRNLGKQGQLEKTKGRLNRGAGTAQRKLGELTGSQRVANHGMERQGKGNLQEGVGRAKQAVDDLTDR